ncbi:hypothetical protein [Sphingobacterium kyonggiense]
MKNEHEEEERINAADSVDPNEVPEVVKEEKDDKPAALNIRTTIIVAIIIMAIIYAIYELMTRN